MADLNKILYIEDEDDIRVIAKISLEDIGNFTVKYCASWQDVNMALKDFSPDLFLLDVMIPNMDGPTILSELRKKPGLEKVPAIFMTAKVQSEEIEEYKKLGEVLDVIAKPFDPMKLAENIRKIWVKQYG